jgi:hypothetical protein
VLDQQQIAFHASLVMIILKTNAAVVLQAALRALLPTALPVLGDML